jgi:hypothetical protein
MDSSNNLGFVSVDLPCLVDSEGMTGLLDMVMAAFKDPDIPGGRQSRT